jgi:hypothetical protein
MPTKEAVIPTKEAVIPTKEAVIPAKAGIQPWRCVEPAGAAPKHSVNTGSPPSRG